MGTFDSVADIYEKSRYKYPPEFRNHLVEIGALAPESAVVDLGAGTGQLAAMAAEVAGQVVAIDPEPDMVRVGKRTTSDQKNIRWESGSDHELRKLVTWPVDLVLIGNAFHHMDQTSLLSDLDEIVTPSGAVVVCSTSIPVWLHDTDWSATLRKHLSAELGRTVGGGGVPNHDSDMVALGSSKFSEVETWVFSRDQRRTGESIVGEVVSSTSGELSSDAVDRLLEALDPHLTDGAVLEHVTTTALIARRPGRRAPPLVEPRPSLSRSLGN